MLGVSVLIIWLKRVWRCAEPDCPTGTWSEMHELIAPRAVLTSRAITWATDALAHDDTRSAVAASNTRSVGAGTRTTRCTRSAGCSGTGRSI
jgi:hypothetical protein